MSILEQLKKPIIQAPMAGSTTPALVSAVSDAGALGSFGAALMSPDDAARAIHEIRENTKEPFNFNVFSPEPCTVSKAKQENMREILKQVTKELHADISLSDEEYKPPFEKLLKVALEENVPVFSFTFGAPEKAAIDALKENGTFVIGTATNLEEAKILETRGVNAIVLQGVEAGGHRGTFDPLKDDKLSRNALFKAVYRQVNLPLIAAGGIGNHQDVKSALDMGASAVQIGTLFLTTDESGANSTYRAQLLAQTEDSETVLTRAFTGRFARAIPNLYTKRMAKYEDDILSFPIQGRLSAQIRKTATKEKNKDFMSLWAGEKAYLCEELSAKELLDILYPNE